MSGRFTPAAETLIRTSSGPTRGTGRSSKASSSAPSGCGATTAIIEDGTVGTAVALLTRAPHRSTIHAEMDLEDLFPSKPDDPLVALGRQDLDPMSIDELKERIETLKAEIARVEAHMQRAQTHRSAADELFKKR